MADHLASLLAGELDGPTAALAAAGRGERGWVSLAEDAVERDPGLLTGAPGVLEVAGHAWRTGTFDTPTLAELTASARGRGRTTSRLSVLQGTHPLTDIGALQALAPPGTAFQVASQFNCLEAPSAHRLVRVADYLLDPTQGPRAAISAFPAALLRHYAAPGRHGPFTQASGGPQLDLLADAAPGYVRNGYLTLRAPDEALGLADALASGFDSIRVGVATGADVVLGANWDGGVPGRPTITQVFTSTLAAGGYSPGVPVAGRVADACTLLLRAAYLGTLLAAVRAGAERVVLTSIGGGVFANPHALIADSVLWALDRADELGAGLDVVWNARALAGPERARLAPVVAARNGILRDLG